jgi:hypothetical protein
MLAPGNDAVLKIRTRMRSVAAGDASRIGRQISIVAGLGEGDVEVPVETSDAIRVVATLQTEETFP